MPSYHKKKYSRRLKKNIIGGRSRKKLNLGKAADVKKKYDEQYEKKIKDKGIIRSCKNNPPKNYDIKKKVNWNRGRVLRNIDLSKYKKKCYVKQQPENEQWQKCEGIYSAPNLKKKSTANNPIGIEVPTTTQCTNCRPYYQIKDLKWDMINKKYGWKSPEDGGVWEKTEIDYFTAKEIGAILVDMLSFTTNLNLSGWLRDTSDLKNLWNAPVPGKVERYFVPTLGQMSLFNLSKNLLKNYQEEGNWKKDDVKVKKSHMDILMNNITDYEKKGGLLDKYLADYKVYIESLNVEKIINNPIETLDGDKIGKFIGNQYTTTVTDKLTQFDENHHNLVKKYVKGKNLLDKVKNIELTYINPNIWFQLFNDWHLLKIIKDSNNKKDSDFIYNLQITNKIRKSISRSQPDQNGLTVSQELMVYLHSSCNYLQLLHSKHQNFKNLIQISLLLSPPELLIGLVKVDDKNNTELRKKIIKSKKKFYKSLNPPQWATGSNFKGPYPTM